MGLRIQNNIAAMNAHRQLTMTDSAMSKSLERLSSGYRINKAADDAAGLAIASSFNADIASYKVANRNVSEANSLAQVAEGAYDQIGNMLTRLKELATQASSANAGSNLDKINDEGNALLNEIDRISNVTEYAGTKLLDGTFGVALSGGTMNATAGYAGSSGLKADTTYNIHVATASGSKVDITVTATIGNTSVSQTVTGVSTVSGTTTGSATFSDLGLTVDFNANLGTTGGASTSTLIADGGGADFQVGAKNTSNDRISIGLSGVTTNFLGLSQDQMLSATDAQSFLDSIDSSIDTLNSARGGIGAIQNRLGYASANLSTTIENVQAAESVIKDVDMADEMTTFTKDQILMQAGTAMLAQANQAPQQVLSLFR
jgi:flagellin